MSRTFSMASTEEPRVLLARARRVARENNGDLRGDESSGSFSGGGFQGVYRIGGGLVTITVTQKPFLVPWPAVESGLRSLLV